MTTKGMCYCSYALEKLGQVPQAHSFTNSILKSLEMPSLSIKARYSWMLGHCQPGLAVQRPIRLACPQLPLALINAKNWDGRKESGALQGVLRTRGKG